MPSTIESITTDPALSSALPADFLYGAASASYQIEGQTQAGGKGECIWDVALRGKEEKGGDDCSSYEQWREDVKLIKSYGFNTYRFSIAWARIKPLGGRDDPVNEEGIAYYSNLIDGLLAEGITPAVTVFHWDHPQALEERYGSFANEQEIVKDFVAYAKILFERFGDRVRFWITINEPHIFSCFSSLTYMKDKWDHKTSWPSLAKTLLLCHAHTVDLYRREFQAKQGGTIGITHNCDFTEPLNPDDPKSVAAAQNILHHVLSLHADPIYLGKWPDYLHEEFGDAMPTLTDEEWKLVKGSSEFFGLNHYGTSYTTGQRLSADKVVPFRIGFGSYEQVYEKNGEKIGVKGHNGHPYNVPWGFRKLLNYIHKRYLINTNLKIYVTENGYPVENEGDMPREQAIKDVGRQDYFAGYLGELVRAHKEDGVRMGGYMAWSLLDNLEWINGYGPRFGLTVVDRKDGFRRYPKDSALLLGRIFEHVVAKK